MDSEWPTDYPYIRDRGLDILKTQKLADVRFLVGSANPCMFWGHKLILAMASPVFDRMFFGLLPENDVDIVISDVEPDTFQALLEYIYSDHVRISSLMDAYALLYVAKKYMVRYLVLRCTDFISGNLNPQNAAHIYEFAEFFDEPKLKQKCLKLIANDKRKAEKSRRTNREISNETLDFDIELDREINNLNSFVLWPSYPNSDVPLFCSMFVIVCLIFTIFTLILCFT